MGMVGQPLMVLGNDASHKSNNRLIHCKELIIINNAASTEKGVNS
jgi:hypothetical protein